MLRRVLARRVEKRALARGEEPAAHADLIEETIARALRAGLLDDARFAAARLATLRRRGTSTRRAGAALAAKGVEREVVEAVLAREQDERGRPEDDPDETAERRAALSYARRRRLGPYRPVETRAAHRERDLAALARAGFAYPLAREIVDTPEDDPGL